ncbi:MAG: hypothetical protein HY321_03720 [Armatimonadetes bacterium]|nr:hypothetical protein [Armatimonadota bacterium]
MRIIIAVLAVIGVIALTGRLPAQSISVPSPMAAIRVVIEMPKPIYLQEEEIPVFITVANTGVVPLTMPAPRIDSTSLRVELYHAETGDPVVPSGISGIGPERAPSLELRKAPDKGRPGAGRPRKLGPAAIRTQPESARFRPAPLQRKPVEKAGVGGLGPEPYAAEQIVAAPGEALFSECVLLAWYGNLRPGRYVAQAVYETQEGVIESGRLGFTIAPLPPVEQRAYALLREARLAPTRKGTMEKGRQFLNLFPGSVFSVPLRQEMLLSAIHLEDWASAVELGRGLYAQDDFLAYRHPTPFFYGEALGRLGMQDELRALLGTLPQNEARAITDVLAAPPRH